MMKALSLIVCIVICLVSSGSAQAFDLSPPNPEIDPGSMASALTLLAGTGLLIADKLRRARTK